MRLATAVMVVCVGLWACGSPVGGNDAGSGGSGGSVGGSGGSAGGSGGATGGSGGSTGGSGGSTGGNGGATGGNGGSTGGSGGAVGGSGGAVGGSGGSTGGAGGSSLASYEPVTTTAVWGYDTTEPNPAGGTLTGTKTVSVQSMGSVPGNTAVTAWRLFTDVPGSQTQLTWQTEDATAIRRYRDEVYALDGGLLSTSLYTPSKLRLSLTGVTPLTETYTETLFDALTATTTTPSHTDRWVIINGAESVTVPLGTFTALHIQKQTATGTVNKDYWFVRGVGKVKETSAAGRTESLRTFTP